MLPPKRVLPKEPQAELRKLDRTLIGMMRQIIRHDDPRLAEILKLLDRLPAAGSIIARQRTRRVEIQPSIAQLRGARYGGIDERAFPMPRLRSAAGTNSCAIHGDSVGRTVISLASRLMEPRNVVPRRATRTSGDWLERAALQRNCS